MPDLATNLTTAAPTLKDMAANLADTAVQGNLAATAETMKANLALGERGRREDRLIHRLGQYERIVAALNTMQRAYGRFTARTARHDA